MFVRMLSVALGLSAAIGLSALADDPKPEAPTTAEGAPQEPSEPGATPADDAPKKGEDAARTGPDAGAGAGEKPAAPKLERATFGGGCFWCLEAVFERIEGVERVVSGYAGGTHPRPTYTLVSAGLTGHAEVVQITYDPEVVDYETLLEVFWHCHDPTTLNRQGPDFGTQYRSIILYHDEPQREAALASYRKLTESGAFAGPIVTQLVPLRKFFPAEKYHQDYFDRNKSKPYCQAEIVPKLRKLGLLNRRPQSK